ncbi:hypothetical protein UFOVP116_161 [uncultured Caudovirales phage]|uniref:Uncharacterized protein n=1 Tax=uncultured Caudovirales phage TaxID=2100421 RepID=A0A6J5L992_9CAUD|nr:hypothetical protein UFOVP116_161 [uncultured Caudovirales phage]
MSEPAITLPALSGVHFISDYMNFLTKNSARHFCSGDALIGALEDEYMVGDFINQDEQTND